MEVPSEFKSVVAFAAARNAELIRRYRESAHAVRNPAVVRLLHSVLDQKASQADLLRAVEASGDAGREVPAIPPDVPTSPSTGPDASGDPAPDLLRTIRAEEERMEALFEGLREAASIEDNRQRLHSLAETSRKIGGWARDHLELLALF